jgi:hypothetical protein
MSTSIVAVLMLYFLDVWRFERCGTHVLGLQQWEETLCIAIDLPSSRLL